MIFGGFYFLRLFHIQRRAIRPNPAISYLIRLTTASLIAAATVWLIDYNLCVYVNGVSEKSVLRWNPQFHAWWHFLAAFGLYSQLVLIMYYHYDMREMEPEIVMWKGVLPTVTLKAAGKKVD